MKKQDAVKELSSEELAEKDRQSRAELFNLRFQKGTGQLENTGRIREVRRTIARVKTALRQKELKG